MTIDSTKSPYSIKADGITDNSFGLKKLQADMSASKTKPIVYLPVGGTILSSFTRWTYGVRSFKVIGSNTTLRSLYKGDDEAQQRGLFAGEMMQKNVIDYKGTKEYVTPIPIETARAADETITVRGFKYFKPDERLFIRSGDLFSGGYPRACRNFESNVVLWNDGSLFALKMPLKENHFDYDTPEVFSLDEVNYCDHAEFEGITFGGNFATPPSKKCILRNCRIENWFWISECEEVYIDNVYAEKVEFDKLVDSVICNRLRTPSSPSNGGSINSIVMNDCETGSIRLCPRYLEINRPKVWANKVLISENPDKYDPYIPCIADAPARNPIRRLMIDECTFTSGEESKADNNLEFAPIEEIVI
jgi:hypothetical protein